MLWLAASADRRVSIWSADWSKDFCELVDWLTFPAPPIGLDGKAIRKGDPVSVVTQYCFEIYVLYLHIVIIYYEPQPSAGIG